MLAWDEREGFVQILLQFLDRAGFSGIVARGLNAASQRTAGAFKAADIVALPAMEGDRNGGERLQDGFGIDAEFGRQADWAWA